MIGASSLNHNTIHAETTPITALVAKTLQKHRTSSTHTQEKLGAAPLFISLPPMIRLDLHATISTPENAVVVMDLFSIADNASHKNPQQSRSELRMKGFRIVQCTKDMTRVTECVLSISWVSYPAIDTSITMTRYRWGRLMIQTTKASSSTNTRIDYRSMRNMQPESRHSVSASVQSA